MRNAHWYDSLVKSPLNPPPAVFGVVWTILYILIGLAAIAFIRADGDHRLGLTLFVAQLVLNLAWTPIFFRARKIGLSVAVIVSVWALLIATIIVFWKTSPLAAGLLIPYLIWVSFAIYLNVYIWARNPKK